MQIKSLVYTLIFFFILSCTSKKEEFQNTYDDISNYQDYILEVSHGIISARSDVRVVFKHPLESWNPGDELDNKLLRVSPKIKGKVVALDNKTLSFVPENGFKQDTEYRFTLDLEALLKEVPEALEAMTFGIKTLKQQFNVYTNPIQSYSKAIQYIEGQIRSSDHLALATVKELVSVERNGKSVDVVFNEAVKSGTQFEFKIDSIQRFAEDSELKISWDGSKFDIESSGKSFINIPGKNNFSVLGVRVERGSEQHLLINFSDPLKKGQNFKGLVVLEGDNSPKYLIEGNSLKVYPSKEINGVFQLEVFEGIESDAGFKLKTKYEERVAFEQLKPQLRLLSNGSILPSSSNLKINFETVNLKAVDVSVLKIYQDNILQFLQGNNLKGSYNLRSVARPVASKKIVLQNNLSASNGKWAAHALDLKSVIRPEVGAIYRVEFNYRPSYSTYECTVSNFEAELEDAANYDEEQEDSSWDGVENYYQDYYYNYDWNERENPCHTSYYYDKKVGTNLLASDIGVTIKRGVNKSYFVAVNDILNTNPIAGAKVTFYNYQQQAIGSITTDADGTSIFDSEKLAYFAIVENNGQKNYIKLNDGNALSVSKFKVSGMELKKGIKGFIFGERGVWRPGDTIYLSFMLNDRDNQLPDNHPVKLELLDPYNKVVHREVKTAGVDNFYNFPLKTDENAPTGNWLAKVSVGGVSFTKTVKIETIKPNRLKIKTDFEEELLSGFKPIKGNMQVNWLHGAIAKNLKVDVNAKFNARTTVFESYPGYTFDDPTRPFSPEEQIVYDGTLDGQGRANFSMTPQLSKKAPGMLTAAFITKVYENGGDFSTDVFTKTYAPYKTYVGLSVPKGDKTRAMLLTDTKHAFEVISVDEKGNPKATKDLKVTIHKVNWRWWWDTSADNLSSFSSSNYREKVLETTVSTGADGKGTFEFELKYPNWGRYLVRVEDENGGHASGKAIYIDWPGWAGKSRKNDPSAATMLVFSTDKENYNVQETATITFPSSEGGRALVTIENGTEVLESL
ncbi:MAG: alpha-2-macroglobulin, partial [Flavobacteriaceae bacterium]